MPTVRLVNPSRSRRRRSSRTHRRVHRRRRNTTAAQRAARSAFVRKFAGGGHMAKKRHHRRRSHNPHRRHRSNPRRHHRHSLMLMGHRRHHRRRNPSLRGLTGGLIPLSIGAGVGYFGSRMIPSSIPFLQPYNTGPTGFLLNLGSGYALYALAGLTNATRRFRPGILVGTVIAVAVRAYETYAMPAAPISAPAAAVSGDLGYYVSDRFPFPQGTGGPYDPFVGTPALATPPFSTTSAAGVRAGQAAAAAALTPGAAGGRGADGSPLQVEAERWGSVWR